MSQSIQIKRLTDADCPRWDDFVNAHPAATFFHLADWKKVLERAFKHKTHFLFAESGGEIVGTFSLAHVKSLLFGNALISLPFAVYGGVLAESDEIQQLLEDKACEIAEKYQVDHLEVRNLQPQRDDWAKKSLHVTFRKEIAADNDENLKNIPRKQRAVVRKGIKSSLVSEIDDNVDRFYALYSESVRNLGTPVFSKKYFKVLKEIFGDQCEVLTITHEGQPVASVVNFYFRDQVLPYYGGGGMGARKFKANDFMYWEVMRRACDKGLKWFDFGRSKKETGSYSFKKNWGFEPEPLHYEFKLVNSGSVPDLNPLNPKYQFFIKTWKKLPLPVANIVGPHLAKYLG